MLHFDSRAKFDQPDLGSLQYPTAPPPRTAVSATLFLRLDLFNEAADTTTQLIAIKDLTVNSYSLMP